MPKRSQDESQERSRQKCKNIKKPIVFFNDFGVSGWSKMSEKWISRGLQDRMAEQEGKMSENGAKLDPR